MNVRLAFSWVGLVVFALPMLPNIAYAVFPPVGAAVSSKNIPRWLETAECISRIAYLAAMIFLVSEKPYCVKSGWAFAAALFLLLYYIVWVRYFVSGRDIALLGKPFLFVPIPLAVFPVLYYLLAAIWAGNIPAAAIMAVFGAAHITVSAMSFC